MKKSYKTLVALTVALASFGSGAVYALDGESDVEIQVTKGTIIPPIVDPGVNPPIGGTDFQLWKSPKEFKFTKTEYNPLGMTIVIDPTEETSAGTNPLKKVVAVADLRGTGKGWDLKAKIKDGKLVGSTTSDEIIGSTIDMTLTRERWDVTSPTVQPSQGPSAGDITVQSNVVISATAAPVMSAGTNEGQGYQGAWIEGIQLNIPAGQGKADVYTGTIEWILTAGA